MKYIYDNTHFSDIFYLFSLFLTIILSSTTISKRFKREFNYIAKNTKYENFMKIF
nr:MAG TPA: hypothetical protein [Caudoviricetes sp.]